MYSSPIANYVSSNHLSPSLHASTSSVSSLYVPKTVQETISLYEWQRAMEVAMEVEMSE